LEGSALFFKDILPHYEAFDAEFKIWVAKWKNTPKKVAQLQH